MAKFLRITWHEIIVYNRSYNMIFYNAQFLILSLLCLLFVYPGNHDLSTLGCVFLIAGIPISSISTSKAIIKNDLEDGSIALYLLSMNITEIVMSKFCALLICNATAFLIALPIITLLYSLSLNQIFLLLSASFIFIQISALSLLISCVESYFRSNVNFISSIIVPLILPGLIISGLIIHNTINYYIGISALIGISLIISPIALICAGYLIRNIYNI
jgi:heme exporter protein B